MYDLSDTFAAEYLWDERGVLAHDALGLSRGEVDQPAGDLPILQIQHGDQISRLEVAAHVHYAAWQQAGAIGLQKSCTRAVVNHHRPGGHQVDGQPRLSAGQSRPGQHAGAHLFAPGDSRKHLFGVAIGYDHSDAAVCCS